MEKKTLAALRAEAKEGAPSRPERSRDEVCLRSDLLAQVQALEAQIRDLEEAAEQATPRRKMTQAKAAPPDSPELQELRAQMAAVVEQMRAYEGTVTLRAVRDDGDWLRWCNEHPARGEDEPGHERDMRVTGGFCNADALITDLGTYVTAWNGEPLEQGDYEVLGIPSPYLRELATLVVGMYEWDSQVGKALRGWSATLADVDSSKQPETSASPNGASSAGSQKSARSTTTKPAA